MRANEIARRFDPTFSDMGSELSCYLSELVDAATGLGAIEPGIARFPRSFRCLSSECDCHVYQTGTALDDCRDFYEDINRSMLKVEATRKEVEHFCRGMGTEDSCGVIIIDREKIREKLGDAIEKAERKGKLVDEIYDVIHANHKDFMQRCVSRP